MTAIHPNLCLAVWAAALAAGMAGCSNQPGALKNPFSTVDRVPPPATRMLAPGTAQPYYQGDPLPVMQSAVGTPAPPATTVATSAPTPSPTNAALPPSPEPKQIVFSNEPTVAIPSDGNVLRFELPPPPEPTPVASVAVVPVPAQAGVVPAASVASQANSSPVVNAAYETAAEPASTGPWRAPQIASPTSPAYAPQPFASPTVAAPITGYPPSSAAAGSMDVELRAVPSPAPEPVAPTTPRIRLPGYSTSPVSTGVGAAVQPMTYFVPAGTPGAAGTLQTVPVLTVPQGYFDAALGAFVYTQAPAGSLPPPTAPASVSGDGFRPRGNTR